MFNPDIGTIPDTGIWIDSSPDIMCQFGQQQGEMEIHARGRPSSGCTAEEQDAKFC